MPVTTTPSRFSQLGGVAAQPMRDEFETKTPAAAQAFDMPWTGHPILSWSDRTTGIVPPADVFCANGDVYVQMPLPGISSEDIVIHANPESVTIRAQRKPFEAVYEFDYYRRELYFGTVQRTVALPFPIKIDQVSAKFRNGLLSIQAPYSDETPEFRRIAVQ